MSIIKNVINFASCNCVCRTNEQTESAGIIGPSKYYDGDRDQHQFLKLGNNWNRMLLN